MNVSNRTRRTIEKTAIKETETSHEEQQNKENKTFARKIREEYHKQRQEQQRNTTMKKIRVRRRRKEKEKAKRLWVFDWAQGSLHQWPSQPLSHKPSPKTCESVPDE
jgi:hypothetical protein